MKKRLSVIIPAYNEEENISHVVSKINSVAPKYCSDFELIIINDGSVDRTGKILDKISKKDKKVKVFHNPVNLGMGYSYQLGLKNAKFEFVMINFGDDDHPPESLAQILSQMNQADIIIPFYTTFHITKTWFRHVLSVSYTHLVNYLTGLRLRYYNGITLHKTLLVRNIPNLSTGFGFQAEIIVHLIKNGATFKEVGITNQDDPSKGSSALRVSNMVKVLYSLGRLYWFYKVK